MCGNNAGVLSGPKRKVKKTLMRIVIRNYNCTSCLSFINGKLVSRLKFWGINRSFSTEWTVYHTVRGPSFQMPPPSCWRLCSRIHLMLDCIECS